MSVQERFDEARRNAGEGDELRPIHSYDKDGTLIGATYGTFAFTPDEVPELERLLSQLHLGVAPIAHLT